MSILLSFSWLCKHFAELCKQWVWHVFELLCSKNQECTPACAFRIKIRLIAQNVAKDWGGNLKRFLELPDYALPHPTIL